MPLAGLPAPAAAVIAAITWDERPAAPSPDLELATGDEVLVVPHSATEDEVRAVFP